MPFSAEAKVQAAEREVAFRRRVYPGLIEKGRMTNAKAQLEIAIMEEIAADYRQRAEKEKLL